MAVNFTPNVALAKPTESELALNWTRTQNLADDNNDILVAETLYDLNSYTATLICSTTNPSVGAGSINAEYAVIGNFVFGDFFINFIDPGVGAGTGTGAYAIELPFVVDATSQLVNLNLTDVPGAATCIGEGQIVDASTAANSGTIALDAVTTGGKSYARFITETYAGKAANYMTVGHPFTVATSDRIAGSFFYKRV